MKKTKFIFILLVIVLIIVFFIKLNLIIKPKTTEQKLFDATKNYPIVIDKSSLLDAYLNNKAKIILQNNLGSYKSLDFSNVFYSNQKILSILDIKKTDSDQQKAEKIYKFVKKLDFKYPLFLNGSINPSVIYSINGFGDCGTAANLICIFSHIYNIDCKSWNFNGHAATELFYNNNWHLYDSIGIGTIIDNKQIANLGYVILLAKKNKLSVYNKEYAATQNHSLVFYPFLDKNDLLEQQIILNFFPYEKKVFLDDSFFVKNLSLDQNRQYSQKLAVFIREIPLNQSTSINQLKIDDFFPIVGVLIVLDKNYNLKYRELPTVEFLNKNQKIINQASLSSINNEKNVIDLSGEIIQNTNSPIFSITFNNLNNLLNKVHQFKILTVHIYAKKYTDFSQKNILYIKRNDINVSTYIKN